jgi:hypothetical protein
MQLSPLEALKEGFVLDRDSKIIDDVSYFDVPPSSSIDLSIREILVKNDENEIEALTNYKIKPRETVVLVSEQYVCVKPGYVAYVFLKNRLSQKGILALNTGIIDGGFNGPISTIVTNFSNKDVSLASLTTKTRGNRHIHKSFFRIVFHQIKLTDDALLKMKQNNPYEYETYKGYKADDLESIPQYFLDPVRQKKEINAEIDIKINDAKSAHLLKLGKQAAFYITVLFLFLPVLSQLFSNGMYKLFFSEEAKITKLEHKVNTLQSQLHKILIQKKPLNSKKGDITFIKDTKDELKKINERLSIFILNNRTKTSDNESENYFVKLQEDLIKQRTNWFTQVANLLSNKNDLTKDILIGIQKVDTNIELVQLKLDNAINDLK